MGSGYVQLVATLAAAAELVAVLKVAPACQLDPFQKVASGGVVDLHGDRVRGDPAIVSVAVPHKGVVSAGVTDPRTLRGIPAGQVVTVIETGNFTVAVGAVVS